MYDKAAVKLKGPNTITNFQSDTSEVRARRVQPGLQGHHRRRVLDPHLGHPAQERQGPDLGHGRPRTANPFYYTH
ncbi:hypothetical protein FH972_005643 [Carpinus fangiana]|uniref:Uncharacterized protein n=1 Tax=Carpinus fangiana TaxID=176857 RepID=A0A5N6QSS4_9ROSI|nr:hypothetical protein FH972_005643 [Carpinus fangiana]